MILNLKYLLHLLLALPLFPLLWRQGKQIRLRVPELPPAAGDFGSVKSGREEVGRALRLVTMGESTIAGIGVETHEEGFTGTLARSLSRHFGRAVQWRVLARSGYTAAEVRDKLVPKLSATEPDIVVIGLGGNDTFHFNPPWRWQQHIQSLVVAIRAQYEEAIILFTNMPPVGLFPAVTPLLRFFLGRQVQLLGAALRRQIAGQDRLYYYNRPITWADWQERLGIEAEPEELFSDGVHPSKLTYQIWAEDIARFAAKVLEKEGSL